MSNSSASTARLAVECLEDRTVPTFLPAASSTISVNGVVQPTGGLSIAAGNLLPDGLPFGLVEAEYVTGTGPGPEALVRIWSRGGILRNSFNPFPGFTGGINVAIGDVIGDGQAEILVTPASNGPPFVGVFNASGQFISGFFVGGNTTFMGGLNIAAGNVLGGISAGGYSGGLVSSQFKQEIIVGTATQASFVVVTDGSGNIQRAFEALPGFTGGVTVAAGNMDSTRTPGFNFFGPSIPSDTNSYDEIVVGAASQVPGVTVWSVWQGGATRLQAFFAFDPAIRAGVTLAAGSTDDVHGAEIFVSLVGTSTIHVYIGETGAFAGEFTVYPAGYSRVVNMTVAYLTPPGRGGPYDPSDDDTIGGDSFDFDTQDLAVVAGDGPFQQEPRYFIGRANQPAGFGGPPP